MAHHVRIRCRAGHPSREIVEVFLRHEKPKLLAEIVSHHGEVAGRELYEASYLVGLSYGRLPESGRGMAWRQWAPVVEVPGQLWPQWRLTCPSCGTRRELLGSDMLRLLRGFQATGQREVDLGLLATADDAP